MPWHTSVHGRGYSSFDTVPVDVRTTARGALAGAVAAGVWAASEPLDRRVFGVPFSDTELLGKVVTRGRAWLPVGIAIHLANGAVFGAGYANVAGRVPLPPWTRGPAAAMVEHLATWPLTALVDARHPARHELPPIARSPRAFAQETWRHLLFGVVLGELERRLNPPPPPSGLPYAHAISSNGHGDIEHAVGASER
jgi:hypothetical protein